MRISIQEACQLLDNGDVVAVPTETVYGLAAKASDTNAIAKIFDLKKRPANNPLIVHLSDASQLNDYAKALPKDALKLCDTFWPGPLTLVLEIHLQSIPETARAGLPTVAFRAPQHPLAREIIDAIGPIVAPSANVSGRPSATLPEHVEDDFGKGFPVVDGGSCKTGVESTILLHTHSRWQIVRLGALPADAFTDTLGYTPTIAPTTQSDTIVCPGRLHRHYAPKALLHLHENAYDGSIPVVLGFDDRSYPGANAVLSLGNPQHPEQALARLYATLRQLDALGATDVWVDAKFPSEGLWKTLRERLSRASQAQHTP